MNRLVTLSLEPARGFFGRACGLLGRTPPAPGQGLWISPCNAVHTFGMHYAIDVVFLDAEGRILRIEHGLRPFRTATCTPASSVVEMCAGQAGTLGLEAGDRLRLPETSAVCPR